MRPNGEEVLRGIQGSLTAYVLPELQSAYARTELMLALGLLGLVADEWDVSAQRLVDGNAALRELARHAADALSATPGSEAALADEVRSLGAETDSSLRLSELSAANARLRDAIARVATAVPHGEALRSEIIKHFQAEAEARSLSLLGPRADG